MNAPLIFAPPGEVGVAAALVEAVASWDECVLLLGEAGMDAVLDRAAHELSARRVRCVRVRAPASGGLALRGLMAQVVGRTDPNALTDEDLEAGFAVLTEPGDGHDRVALMVEGAHGLLPPAVRYIQLACRSSPQLRVVLAGRPGLEAVLVGDEFAALRRRFTRRLALPGPGADGPAPDARSGLFSAAPGPLPDAPPTPALFARVRDAAWTLTKVGLAASLVVWMVRLSSPSPPPALQRASLADVADPSDAPTAAPPRAGSAAPLAVWTTRWEDVPAPPGLALPDPGRPAASGVKEPVPAGRETPVMAAPFVPPAVESAAPPRGQPAMDQASPAGAAPPAVADVPAPAVADMAAPRYAEDKLAPAPTSPPVPADVAVQDTPPAGITPPSERDTATAPVPAQPPREGLHPPVEQKAAGAGPNAPEAPAQDAGHVAARAPEPALTPLAPAPAARDVGHAAARVPEPAPTPFAPEPAAQDVGHAAARVPVTRVPEPLPAPSAPEPVAAALPLPPIPPPPSPQPAPRPPVAAVPQPEVPNAARRARAATERTSVAPAAGARSDERRCRDLVLKAQLGETLSDAEKQFLRGGCRVE